MCLPTLSRRAAATALRANVGPLDAFMYVLAIAWLLTLAVLPPGTYVHIAPLHPLLAYKDVWVWPAILGVLAPPFGWITPWRWAHRVARLYKLGYWLFLTVATWLVAPSLFVFWLPTLASVFGVLWLMAREGADELAAAAAG